MHLVIRCLALHQGWLATLIKTHLLVSFVFLSAYSEFELHWFDLDAREANENVRTTRSMAKATRMSASSSGKKLSASSIISLLLSHILYTQTIPKINRIQAHIYSN